MRGMCVIRGIDQRGGGAERGVRGGGRGGWLACTMFFFSGGLLV